MLTYSQYLSYGHSKFHAWVLSRPLWQILLGAIIIGIVLGTFI